MDTTAKYVKMCEKTEEIQALKQLNRDGDFFATDDKALSNDKSVFVNCHDEFEEYAERALAEYIQRDIDADKKDRLKHKYLVWLPCQDQLQEIVFKNRAVEELIYDFYRWFTTFLLNDSLNHWFDNYTTMEQLWLAFVMKQRYSKVWSTTKKDWVKED